MITLKWSRFPESYITSYNVYRAIIGFKAPIVNIVGKTLILRMNGGTPQTIMFNTMSIVDTINSVLNGGKAYPSQDGFNFYVRSIIRQAPGSVEIMGGSALMDLGLSAKLITEKSDAMIIANPLANVNPNAAETFTDPDGVFEDFYAIASISPTSIESLKTPWQQPIQSAGPICVVEGLITDVQGVRIPDCEIIANLVVPPKNLQMAYITKEPVRTLTSVDGRFSLPLLQGALVKFEVPSIGYSQMVTIPSKSYIFMKDLLVDEDYAYPTGTL